MVWTRQRIRQAARLECWEGETVDPREPRMNFEPRHLRRAHSEIRRRRFLRRERMIVFGMLVGSSTYGAQLTKGGAK